TRTPGALPAGRCCSAPGTTRRPSRTSPRCTTTPTPAVRTSAATAGGGRSRAPTPASDTRSASGTRGRPTSSATPRTRSPSPTIRPAAVTGRPTATRAPIRPARPASTAREGHREPSVLNLPNLSASHLADRARDLVRRANEDRRSAALLGGTALAFVLLVGVAYPAPLPIFFLGLVVGSLSGLVAVGLVLVYRANRIINFAQGSIGGLAGVFAASLIVGPKWPYLLAVAVALVAAFALGGF